MIQVERNRKDDNDKNKTFYAERATLDDFIGEMDEKEKIINALVDGYKKDQSAKIEHLENQLTSLKRVQTDFNNKNDTLNKMIADLKAEIKLLDKRALYSSTFNNYKRNHESDFLNKVQVEEKKLKEDILKIINEKLATFTKNSFRTEEIAEKKINRHNKLKELTFFVQYVFLSIFEGVSFRPVSALSIPC